MNTDITIHQLSKITGLNVATLRRLARDNNLPGAYRIGRIWLISKEIFDAHRGIKPEVVD